MCQEDGRVAEGVSVCAPQVQGEHHFLGSRVGRQGTILRKEAMLTTHRSREPFL